MNSERVIFVSGEVRIEGELRTLCFTRFLFLGALLLGSRSWRGRSTIFWSALARLATNGAFTVAEAPGLFTSGITSAMRRSALDREGTLLRMVRELEASMLAGPFFWGRMSLAHN